MLLTRNDKTILMWLAERPLLKPTLTGFLQELRSLIEIGTLSITITALERRGYLKCPGPDYRYSITKEGMAALREYVRVFEDVATAQ